VTFHQPYQRQTSQGGDGPRVIFFERSVNGSGVLRHAHWGTRSAGLHHQLTGPNWWSAARVRAARVLPASWWSSFDVASTDTRQGQLNRGSPMAELGYVALGIVVGVVAYHQAATIEKRSGVAPWGVSPPFWAATFLFVGFVGAVVASPLVLGGLAGFGGYRAVMIYEQQRGGRLLGCPTVAWGIGCGSLGAVGARVTSTLVWGVVCAFFALLAALVLSVTETIKVRAERDALIAELNTHKSAVAGLQAASSTSRPSPESTVLTQAPAPPSHSSPTHRRSSFSDQTAAFPSGSAAAPDLLPRRR